MSIVPTGPRKILARLGAVLGMVAFLGGCAGEDPQFQKLSKQQAATIESLNAEIVRLNDEVDEAVYARERLAKVKDQLAKKLAGEIARGEITLLMEKRGLVIRFLEDALFETGKVSIRDSARVPLDKIADVLAGEFPDNKVIVEGHTDDALPLSSGWRSSWEYTNVLPTEILHYFIDVRRLNPARFSIASCAEYQRANAGNTEDGRERNRRVEIVVTPQKLGKS